MVNKNRIIPFVVLLAIAAGCALAFETRNLIFLTPFLVASFIFGAYLFLTGSDSD